jgi:GT2 family glycosyltransferase
VALTVRPARPAIAVQLWILFAFASVGLLGLCLAAGALGPIGARPMGWQGILPQGLNLPAGQDMLNWALIWFFCLLLLPGFPRRLPPTVTASLILCLALLCRLALLPQEPSDDIYRYLWEGRLLTLGINPYQVAPADPSLTLLAAADPFHTLINHPRSPAIYPPLILYLFAFIGRLSYTPMAMKALVTAVDLAALGLLVLHLYRRGLPLQWSVLYAFNPVILYAFAGQGHFDAVHIFFLLAALLLYDRRRWGWMFLCLGVAIQIKYVALGVLPFFLGQDNWRRIWVALAAVAIPYLFLWDENWRQCYAGLQAFAGQSAFNGSLHTILRLVLGDIAPATSVCKVLLGLVLLCGYVCFHPHRCPRFRNDPISGCFFVLGALLLFSPTVHFWYLSWVVVFLPFRPQAAWMLLCLTVALSLTAFGDGRWDLSLSLQAIEWLPFFVLLVREAILFRDRQNSPMPQEAAALASASVSVIIPVLNEAERIGDCIASVFKDPVVSEVIVVDGGSSDGTADRAMAAGARVICDDRGAGRGGGRGGQIRSGMESAAGDVVAVVHADVRIDAWVFSRMLHLLRCQPAFIGGAVGSIFDAPGWGYRLLELANDLRAVATGISFGDQIQFFRRKALAAAGGFPALPLMEDVELGLRLQHMGLQTFLFGTCPVSARKWRTAGLRQAIKVLRLTGRYLWQRAWHNPDTAAMYRRYYTQEKEPPGTQWTEERSEAADQQQR